MTPEARTLDQRLRRGALARIRESSYLSSEYEEERQARRPSVLLILYYVLISPVAVCLCFGLCMLPLSFIALSYRDLGYDGTLGLFSLAFLAGAQLLTLIPRLALKRSQLLNVAAHVPMPDRTVVWRVTRNWLLISLISLWFSLFFYGFVYWNIKGLGLLEAGSAALLQWLVCIGTVPLLTAWIGPRLFGVSFVLVLIAIAAISSFAGDQRDQTATLALFCFPTGWVNGVMQFAMIERHSWAWWLLLPIAIWILLGLWSQIVLIETYRIDEIIIQQGMPAQATARLQSALAVNLAADSPGPWHDQYEDLEEPEASEISMPVDPRAVIRSREFLDKYEWQYKGWLERLITRLLTARELAIIDFLSSSQIQWTDWWLGILVNISMLLLVGLFWKDMLPFAYTSITLTTLWCAFAGPYPAFRARPCGGVLLPQFALFPIGRDEAGWAMFKVTFMRCICGFWLAVLLIAFALTTGPVSLFVSLGSLVVLAILGLVHITFQFAIGTQFPDWGWRNCVRRTLLCLPVILPVALMLVFVLLSLVTKPRLDVIRISLGLSFVITLFVSYYLARRYYRQGDLDAVRTKRHALEFNAEQYEQLHFRAVREQEMAKKHGWFWWLKRLRHQGKNA